jgi:hypothetical protein
VYGSRLAISLARAEVHAWDSIPAGFIWLCCPAPKLDRKRHRRVTHAIARFPYSAIHSQSACGPEPAFRLKDKKK